MQIAGCPARGREDPTAVWLVRPPRDSAGCALDAAHLLFEAQERVARRLRAGARDSPHWLQEWARVLDQPLDETCAALVEQSERGQDLRQTSPFVGILTEAEGLALYEQISRAPSLHRPRSVDA